jgi:hypothetical protein
MSRGIFDLRAGGWWGRGEGFLSQTSVPQGVPQRVRVLAACRCAASMTMTVCTQVRKGVCLWMVYWLSVRERRAGQKGSAHGKEVGVF